MNICLEISVFLFNCKINTQNNTFNYVIFYNGQFIYLSSIQLLSSYPLLSRNSQQQLNMFTCISAHVDTSDHGLSQTLKSPRVVANGFTGIKMNW
jgi:hypothetical protein